MVDLLVDGLACWRLTHLIVEDAFPPVAKTRDRILDRCGPDHWASYLVTCTYCMGVWSAVALTFAPRWLRRLLAVAAAAPLVEAAAVRLEGGPYGGRP